LLHTMVVCIKLALATLQTTIFIQTFLI
jgi:hypothetical protein